MRRAKGFARALTVTIAACDDGRQRVGFSNTTQVTRGESNRINCTMVNSKIHLNMDCSLPRLRSIQRRNDQAGSGARKGWHFCVRTIHARYRLVSVRHRSIPIHNCIWRRRATRKFHSSRARPIVEDCGRNRSTVWRCLLGLCAAENARFRPSR